MMKRLIYILPVLIISCEEQFDFGLQTNSDMEYVITGEINQSDGPYNILIQQTKKGSKVPVAVNGACVKLIDSQNNSEEFRANGAGNYEMSGVLIKGTPGMSYHIEIVLPDGTEIVSEPERLPTSTIPDFSIEWEQGLFTTTTSLGIDVETPVVYGSLKIDNINTEEKTFVLWEIEEVYQFLQLIQFIQFTPPPPCYITRPIGSTEIRLFSSEDFDGNSIEENQFFMREIDDSFLRKRIFTITQLSITESNFRHLENIKTLNENTGSIFDSPPGRVIGNLRSTNSDVVVHGYFQAVNYSVFRFAIYPDEIPNLPSLVRTHGCSDGRPEPPCWDCSLLANSTFTRPSFFDEVD